MVCITGKYKLESQENFDGFLQAIGVNAVKRKLAAVASPTIEVAFDGTKYNQVTKGAQTSTMACTIGQEYEHNSDDAGKGKLIMVMIGDDTLVTTQVGGGGTKITRKFTDAGMEVTMAKDGVTCVRKFKRI